MKEVLKNFVLENGLSPFISDKVSVSGKSIYQTRDAKAIHTKVLNKVSSNFCFSGTSSLWNCFPFCDNFDEISVRQKFFLSLSEANSAFFGDLRKPRPTWSPPYDVIVVTEDEATFVELKEIGCPVQLIFSDTDVANLENYDLVQVIDCETYSGVLERLPQSVFVGSVEDIYLERFLTLLSGWKDNFDILKSVRVSGEIRSVVERLEPLFRFVGRKAGADLSVEGAEKVLVDMNERISDKVKDMTISGDSLLKILGEGKVPEDLLGIIESAISESGFPQSVFNLKIPVELDYGELDSQIRKQSANEFSSLAEEIKRSADEIREIPRLLDELSALILVEDFCVGVANFIREDFRYPTFSENFHLSDSRNLFLGKAQPISFQLDNFSKCSILTGANSGGKTTLLEHVLQTISLYHLGLPISGEVHMPVFSDVYYFAKNKGSASKGAFETLLTQMSEIKPGERTLILADEIEAVTEPGVAGKIISATAEYFIRQDCFLIIATHLGYEIQKSLPGGARIDGIEAKGLDENFNLIVDHNPVMGRLAHSTPELIVERMAGAHKGDYFEFLNEQMKKDI